jgi:uncharacterized protein YndB with AHSA1/START domain/uncharacterized protein YciI
MKLLSALAFAALAMSWVAHFARAGDPAPVAAQGRAIHVERIIAAPVDRVWTAWTTSDGWKQAMGLPLNTELRPGGPFEVWFAPDAPEGQRGSEGCKVLSYLPERMLSFSWNSPPKYPELRAKGPQTIVVVEMEPFGEGFTKLSLTHHGWPSAPAELADQWEGSFAYFSAAWPRVLEHIDAGLTAAAAAPAKDPREGWTYLIRIARGVSPDQLTPDEMAVVQQHAAYINELHRSGVVVVAGPCTDFIGPGIVIFHAPDEASARAIMEGDPAVKAGVFSSELHPMYLSFVQ